MHVRLPTPCVEFPVGNKMVVFRQPFLFNQRIVVGDTETHRITINLECRLSNCCRNGSHGTPHGTSVKSGNPRQYGVLQDLFGNHPGLREADVSTAQWKDTGTGLMDFHPVHGSRDGTCNYWLIVMRRCRLPCIWESYLRSGCLIYR
jgi:hypothetical protein